MLTVPRDAARPADEGFGVPSPATIPGLGFLRGWSVVRRDLLLTLALAVALVGIELGSGGGTLEPRADALVPTWTGWLFLTATVAPLPWRRLRPEQVITVSGFATGAYFLVGFTSLVGTVGVLFALYASSGYATSRWDGVISLGVSLVFVTISFAVTSNGRLGEILASYALTMMLFVTSWGLGEATRARRALEAQLWERAVRAEQAQQLEHDRATAQERNRIARELHDVVAHTVAVLVVQAGAGRHVAARRPEQAAEVLGQIETTGREALGELRRVLGVLRGDEASEALPARGPQPTLAALPDLVAPLRAAGMPVDLQVRDRRGTDAPLPTGVEVSAYRIVQEALTNVLKHAGRVDDVAVSLEVTGARLVVTVTDDGRGVPVGTLTDGGSRPTPRGRANGSGPAGGLSTAGGGHGLVGMRERVDMLAGRIDVGPRQGGGFRVRAEIPLDGAGPDGLAPQRSGGMAATSEPGGCTR